jgi:hypothetical protein
VIILSQRDNKIKALIDDFGGLESVLKAIDWMESKGGFSKILQLVRGKKTASLYIEAGLMDKVKKLVAIILLLTTTMGLAGNASAGEMKDKVSEAYNSQTKVEQVQEKPLSAQEQLKELLRKDKSYTREEVQERAKILDQQIQGAVEKMERGQGMSNRMAKAFQRHPSFWNQILRMSGEILSRHIEGSEFGQKYSFDGDEFSKYLDSFYEEGTGNISKEKLEIKSYKDFLVRDSK